MSIKERNLLFRALKEAGIFPNFIQEANKCAAMSGERAIENIMKSSFNYVIDNALYWVNTKLGSDFWDTIDEEFRYRTLIEGEEKSFIAYVGVAAQGFSDVLCKHRDNFLG